MNIIAYIIYLLLTFFITVRVGLSLFRNGRLFLLASFQNNEKLTDSINRILLTGYYLLNLGYAALMIKGWRVIVTTADLVETIATMTGRIMLTLALIHFFNMTAIYFLRKKRNEFIHPKHTS